MLDRLNKNKNRKAFSDVEKTVNDLYNMFSDMKHLNNNDLTVFEKAAALDEAYGDEARKNTRVSECLSIRLMIEHEYKDFNIEYRRSKQPKNTFTQEFVADELKKEDCELISDYKNSNELITYKHEGKEYKVTFAQWRNKGYRPHQCYYGMGSYWKEINDYKKQHPLS